VITAKEDWQALLHCGFCSIAERASPTDGLVQREQPRVRLVRRVRCDEIPWEMFGLSMAGWNAVISAGLMLIWIAAARQRR
jgi:disulfide bond formation protein DsbB